MLPLEVNKLVTEPTNPAPDSTGPVFSADAMEPISVDALQTIAAAKARIIAVREICLEHLSPGHQPVRGHLHQGHVSGSLAHSCREDGLTAANWRDGRCARELVGAEIR